MFWKSPKQMSREAEERANRGHKPPRPQPPKPRKIDSEARPRLDGASFAAYLRSGRTD